MIGWPQADWKVDEDTLGDMAGHEGKHRFDRFSAPQKKTFITMRAMSASPLFIGGALPSMDREPLRLLTNQEMISCNQNGKVGHRVESRDYVQTWLTEKRGEEMKSGWAAVFNRSSEKKTAQVSLKSLGLDPKQSYSLYDVWGDKPFQPGKIELEPNDCVFLRFAIQNK